MVVGASIVQKGQAALERQFAGERRSKRKEPELQWGFRKWVGVEGQVRPCGLMTLVVCSGAIQCLSSEVPESLTLWVAA